MVWKNAPGPRPPSVAKVARRLGVGAARLADALDDMGHLGVASRQTAGGRVRRVVSTEAASAAKQLLDARVAAKTAARQLGLSIARVHQLITDGVLKVSGGKLNQNDVDALRQNVLACAAPGQFPRDGVSLRHVLRYCVPIRRTGAFLGALLRKELTCYLPQTAERAIDVVLSQSLVQAWLVQGSVTPRPALTLPEVAGFLGLKQQVAYHLARKGLIQVVVHHVGKRKAQVVTQQALLAFKSSFVPLAWVAAQAGIDHRHGLRWAQAECLEIASGPTVDGGRQYFVRITDRSGIDAIHCLWEPAIRAAVERLRSAGLGAQDEAALVMTPERD
jgi:hypothetical protein